MRKLRMEELGRLSAAEVASAPKLPLVLVLDNVRSALNVGSVFRTSDAFAVNRIWLCGITATPPHREILKTSLGAENSVSWQYAPSAVEVVRSLKAAGYCVVAVEQAEGSIRLEQFDTQPGMAYALVLGNEVQGVSEEVMELADLALEIPQTGMKHSLNIAVCTGIVTWEFFKKYMQRL